MARSREPGYLRFVTLFDLIAVVVVLLSVLAGFSNGAVREVVGLTAFGLAVVGALLLLPATRPLARALVHPVWASSAAAIVVSFFVIYIGLQLGGRFLTARLRDAGALGRLDRLGGGAIGALRAAVLLGGFFLIYRAVIPAERGPDWVERAALFPASAAAGETLQRITPKGASAAGRLGPSLRNALAGSEDDPGISFGGANNLMGSDDQDAAAPSKPAGNKRHRPETRAGSGQRGLIVETAR